MQSAVVLVYSTARSIRSIAKEVKFFICKFKEVLKSTIVYSQILKTY